MKAEIIVTEGRVGSKVLIDGLDVAPAIKGFQFDAGVGRQPYLCLEGLYLGGAEITADGVAVDLPETTRKTLIRLGWIPPEIARTYFRPDALAEADGSSADLAQPPG